MNSTFLRILAVFMVIAAIVTAYIGYRISNKPPANTVQVLVPSYPQVIARIDISAGHALTAEDMEIVSTQQPDKQAFNHPSDLIGKVLSTAVNKGTILKTSNFPAPSALGRVLAPDERAVAIKVNEVVGVGGFIKPGDHVDVLLYLRKDGETGEISSGQVVLSNVKVLAYGTVLNETEASQNVTSTPDEPNKLGADNRRLGINSAKDIRSAILAVADKEIAKLMLADSTGILRLALRGDALPSADSVTPDNQFIRLGDLSKPLAAAASQLAQPASISSKTSTKSKPIASAPKNERVIIHHGEKVEVVNVAK